MRKGNHDRFYEKHCHLRFLQMFFFSPPTGNNNNNISQKFSVINTEVHSNTEEKIGIFKKTTTTTATRTLLNKKN